MTDLADNFASLSLKDVAGNRFALLNKIQEQVCSAISALQSGKDLLSIKKNVQYILEQVNKNLDLIKASCKEESTLGGKRILVIWQQTSDVRCLLSYNCYQTSDVISYVITVIRRLMSNIRCLITVIWCQTSHNSYMTADIWYQLYDI